MLGVCVENVRKKSPTIHCITNYVTVNDVANAVLAIGASPIMSDEAKDVGDIASVCRGLCINIGTLNEKSIEAMFIAGKRAKELGNVVILDPVGAGASKLRTETAAEIVKKIKPDIIRGNISEIKTLALGVGTTNGVDADAADAVTEENLEEMIEFIKDFSVRANAVVAVTGKIDLVTDGDKCFVIRNGCSQMSRITGTGCMLSALTAAFVCANDDNKAEAVAAAVCTMGLSGEIGEKRLGKSDGNSTLRNYIIDAVYNMDEETLDKGAKYEIR